MDHQTALLVPTFHSFQWVCTPFWRTSAPAAHLVLWASPLPCVEVGWLKRLLHTPFSVSLLSLLTGNGIVSLFPELTTVHLHYSCIPQIVSVLNVQVRTSEYSQCLITYSTYAPTAYEFAAHKLQTFWITSRDSLLTQFTVICTYRYEMNGTSTG